MPDLLDDAHTDQTQLDPGVYPSDRYGHVYLAGTNGRGLRVLETGNVIEVAGVHVTSPEVLEQLADRLQMLADRLRARIERAR